MLLISLKREREWQREISGLHISCCRGHLAGELDEDGSDANVNGIEIIGYNSLIYHPRCSSLDKSLETGRFVRTFETYGIFVVPEDSLL